jgi:hypothetical protein
MSGERGGGGGPGFTVVAELEAAGADAELGVWQASADRLGELQASLVRTLEECEQQHAAHKTAVAAAHVLQARRVTHNEQRCPLLQLVERSDLRSVIMSAEVWGVLGLWRLRGLCRTLRRRGAQQLALLPRVSTVGGAAPGSDSIRRGKGTLDKNPVPNLSLDLATMRWSQMRKVPPLPHPRAFHSTSSGVDGRVVVCCGSTKWKPNSWQYKAVRADADVTCMSSTVLQWLPGTSSWAPLPDLPEARVCEASLLLPAGRTMIIGGRNNENEAVASVLALAADGSEWSELPPMTTARAGHAAVLLPNGSVLVLGGDAGLPPAPTQGTLVCSFALRESHSRVPSCGTLKRRRGWHCRQWPVSGLLPLHMCCQAVGWQC